MSEQEQPSREHRNQVFSSQAPTEQQQPAMPQVPPGVPRQADMMRAELGFEIPVETVPLPTKGLLYPQGHPLHMRETVDIRAMTTKEEDLLTNRGALKKGGNYVISQLIQSCLTDKTINPKDMVAGDRLALMVSVRITGYGAEYAPKITCPDCQHEFEQSFDLSELPIKPLEIQPVAPGQNAFLFKLPASKKDVIFKFLTQADSDAIEAEQNQKTKLNIQNSNVTSELVRSILAIDGNSDKGFISRFVTNMLARDSSALRKYIAENEPGVDMKVRIECTNPDCGGARLVQLPISINFLWPSAV